MRKLIARYLLRIARSFGLLGWLCMLPMASMAAPQVLDGSWYQAPADWVYDGRHIPDSSGLTPVDQVSHIGGRFIFQADLSIEQAGVQVLDFKNTSVIGVFHHRVFDAAGRLVAVADGGIEQAASNPFLLRHGRELLLPPGRYRLVSELTSPFFLAHPEPYIDTLDDYRQAIKPGTALVLLCMGILIGLAIYYTVLALVRRSVVDGMYALFIAGNLLYNGTALLVYPDLLGMHWFYLVSIPILFSNCAYALFVMRLLDIGRDTHPRLYRAGMALLALLAIFIVLAPLVPNWSLELDRYGVALFLLYGLVSGIVRARQGSATARLYLVAIVTFGVLAATAISQSALHGTYTFYMEHLGLVAVTVEALLLALVLAQQFARLNREKESALMQVMRNQELARTDTLTGLPNRYALDIAIGKLPAQGSLTFIDIDGLKYYNDRYGHKRGDELLCRFSHHLRIFLPQCACLHRLGGDEFAITCTEGNVSKVESMIAASVNALHAEGMELAGASFGTVMVAENPAKDQLMRMADERMYAHKRNSKAAQQAS
jgi:diguanylate cyclase (GGDEF)-like protein